MKHVGLSLLVFFCALGPVAPQSAEPKPADIQDITRVLPEDVLVYAGVHDLQGGYVQLKEMFLKKLFATNGEKWWNQMIGSISAEIKKSTEGSPINVGNILKSLRSGHFVLTRLSHRKDNQGRTNADPGYIFVIEFAAAQHVTSIAAAMELMGKAGEYKKHKIYEGGDVSAAGLGKWLIISNENGAIQAMIDRAEGATGRSLASNPLYQEAMRGPSGPSITACADLRKLFRGFRTGGRDDAFGFDRFDAAFGLTQFETAILRLGFKDKEFAISLDVRANPASPLYQLIRNEPRELKVLSVVPAKTPLAMAFSLDAGKTLEKVKTFISEHAELLEIKPDNKDAWKEEARKALGVSLDDLAGVLGNEVALVVPVDIGALFMGQGAGALVLEVTDSTKAHNIWTKIRDEICLGYSWDVRAHKGVDVYVGKYSGGGFGKPRELATAVVDRFFVLGVGEDLVKEHVDAWKDGKSLARNKAVQKKLSAVGGPKGAASWLTIVDPKQLYAAIQAMPGASLPPLAEDLATMADVAVMVDTGKGLSFKSEGMGGAFSFETMVPAMVPITFMAFTSAMKIQISAGLARATKDEHGGMDRTYLKLSAKAEPPKVDLGPEEAGSVKDMVRNLGASSLKVREEATRGLIALKEKAVPATLEVLKSKEPEVRMRAERILVELGRWEYVPEKFNEKMGRLVKGIEQSSEPYWSWDPERSMEPSRWEMGNRYYIPSGPGTPDLEEPLRILESDLGVEVFTRILAQPDEPRALKRMVLSYARRFDTRAAEANLIRAVDDPDPRVRAYSLSMLNASTEPAVAKVKESLKSKDVSTRRAAFLAAERSRGRTISGELVELLKSDDAETRFNADYTLSCLYQQDLGFNAFSKPEVREPLVKRWAEIIKTAR